MILGVYRSPEKLGRTIHCNSPYPGLVSGSGADASNATIKAMVGAARSGYLRDNIGA